MHECNAMKTYSIRKTNSCRPASNTRAAISRPRPISGQRHRPVVPIRPRCNSTLNNIVRFGEQFSSTTIVSGASQGEPTIIHGPLTPRPTKASTQYLNTQDNTWHTNTNPHSNEIMLDTLEVPVETLISEDNEIQTIHIGDFSNVITSDTTILATEETFIASTDSSGKCVVTVQKPKAVDNVHTRFLQPARPFKVKPPVPTSNSESGIRPKNWRVVGYGRSRMIADFQTNIPVAEYKAQLNDTSDIIGKLDIAPPTKRLMQLQNKSNNRTIKTEGAAQLLANSGRAIGSCLLKYFVRHLTTRQLTTEETFPDMELLPLGHTRTVDLTKIKRITRKRFYPEAEEYQRKLLANEQLQLRFEHFVTETESMQTEFLQEEEEILPDYNVTDPIFVEGSLTNFDKEVHEDVMCLYGEDAVVETEGVLGEDQQQPLLDDHSSTIIMVHEQDKSGNTPLTPKNIEVLLAAAEKQGVSRKNIQQVIICQPAVRKDL